MRLLEIKPDGTEVWFHHDPIEKKNTIHYKPTVDVQPVLDYCKALRLAAEYSREGIKREWWHYAHLPNWLLLEVRFKHGVDFWDPNNTKKVFEIVNQHYPDFKMTEKHHSAR